MKTDEEYILGRGIKGSERLIIQQEVLGGNSKALLLKAGLKAGMNVLEAGCGIGLMTPFIAEQIKPNGNLTAIDISDDQLKLAKDYCENERITNVEFRNINILESNTDLVEKFDLVYARLVLGHLSDPVLALQNMTHYLKPGGILVSEETMHEPGLCDPPAEAIDTFFALIKNLQKKLGQSQQGHFIFDHFQKLGLSNIQFSLTKPPLETFRKRKLISLSLQEIRPKFLEHKLITPPELDMLTNQINHFCNLDGFSKYIQITQIFGTKN